MKFSIPYTIALFFVFIISQSSIAPGCGKTPETATKENPYYSRTDTTKLNVLDAEWKKILSDDVYHVAREQGTERAFTGKYWDHTGIGTYYCAVCGNALFKSDGKFASECGWPSFLKPCALLLSPTQKIYHTIWNASKSIADDVLLIWDICLMTVLLRRIRDIV